MSGANPFVVTGAGVAVSDSSIPRAPSQSGWHPVTSVGNFFASPAMSGMAMSGSHLFRVTERFFFMFTANSGSLLEVPDVSDSSHPSLTAACLVGIDARGLPLSGSLALVANGFTGLLILDIADLAKPRFLSTYLEQSDSLHGTDGVAVSGTTACLLGRDGFDTVDVADPRQPKGLGQCRLGGDGWSAIIGAAGNRVFMLARSPSNFVDVVDVSNPHSP